VALFLLGAVGSRSGVFLPRRTFPFERCVIWVNYVSSMRR